MIRFMPKKLWFCITVGMLVFQSAAWGATWDKYPPIEVFYLLKQYDQLWFHISQSCDLTISAYDADSYNDVQYGPYLNGYYCEWFGSDCLEYQYGLSNTWEPTHFTTSAHSVYCRVEDDPVAPDGSNTNDDYVDSPSASLSAWEVKGTMSIGSSSVVMTESGWGPGVDGTSVYLFDTDGLDSGSIEADTSPYANDDGPYDFTVQVNATWELDPVPGSAETYTATGSASVGASMSGDLYVETDDDDLDPFGGGSMSVGVSIAIPPLFGVSVSFSPDFNGEACESVAGAGFGFDSDVLADCGDNDYYTVAVASGDSTNDDTMGFSHYPSGSISGSMSNGVTKEAEIQIEGYVDAVGDQWYNGVSECWEYDNSNAYAFSAGSYSFSMTCASADNLHLASQSKVIYP